jgi:hypothetical protein
MIENSDCSEHEATGRIEYVYVLQSGSSHLFKIGRTSGNVEKRIKQLNTGNPHSLTTFDVIETEEAACCETYLHQRLRTSKHFGSGGTEFFEIAPDDIRSILQDAREFLIQYVAARKLADEYQSTQSEDRSIEPSAELQNDYRRLLEIRRQIDMLTFERELIEFRLKAALGSASELKGIATWKTHLSPFFDKKTFRQDNPNLYAEYETKRPQRTFRLVDK